MSESIIQRDEGRHSQVLDVQRLIEAVRGSRAAQVLYELRPWLPRYDEQREDGAALASAAPLNL